jgi:hypothetical protein
MNCTECGRQIAATGPAYPVDATMTRFRCASCQLAARVKAVALART